MTGSPAARRGSLSGRITALAVSLVAVTIVIAALLVVGITRSGTGNAARRNLAVVADVTAARESGAIARRGLAAPGLQALSRARIQVALVDPGHTVTATNALARAAMTPSIQRRLLAGKPVSRATSVGGVPVVMEGRPTSGGGVLLVQRRADAPSDTGRLLRRILIALAIAGALAALVGALVARQLARPLRRIAASARALATGRRDVAVPVTGPREVADVGESLNTLAVSLTHSEGRQRDFLLSVSHDLRTPLTGIRGYAESLASGVVPPGDAAAVGEVMVTESRRLERLVADLLDLARLDAVEPRVDLRPVDLVALCRTAGVVWSARCRDAGVDFRLAAPRQPVTAVTDPDRLRQVVDGLMENALRVTGAGAPIVLEVRTEPGVAVVEVRDGGPGLAPEDLTVAFEPSVLYERYRGVRPVGTGLGLAIVGRLASLLGGTAEAGNAAEGGARFTVRLPAAATSAQH